MNRAQIFSQAEIVIKIAHDILILASRAFGGHDLSEEEKNEVDGHWQEISRIAAEQAAKPEIQGYSEHE